MSTSATITGGVRQWKPYPAYKESGLSTGVQIPLHWAMMRLKHIAAVRPSNVDKKTVEGQEPVRLCNYVDVYKNDAITPDMDFMRASATPAQIAAYTLKAGDVIITKDSETWMDIAVPAHVNSDLPGVLCGYHLALVRPRKEVVDGAFLFRCFSATGVLDQFRVAANGITRFGLGTGAIADALFPLPPLDEQRRIVEFLDRETAKIDVLIAKKERLIELLQEKRTALVSHAVIRGIESAVPMKDSGLEWVRQIPAHWTVLRNGFLFLDRDQRGYPDLPILEVSIHTGVKVREFSGEHVEQKAEDHSTYKRSLAGDLAFNKMRMWQGAVGVTPVDGLVSPDYQVCRPRPGVHSRYFEQLFRTSFYLTEINRYSHGIVKDRNRLYWDQFKEMPSLVPPPEEQVKIIEHVDAITKRTGAMIAKVQEAIDKLREYRTALISAAVTGKIDLSNETTPVVEPATSPTKPATKPVSPYFRRTVFAAEIIDRLCDEPTFGHVKFQKCLFVAQHHLRIGDFEESYKRMAAGPYDNRLVRSVDSQLEKQHWFKAEKASDRYAYRRLDKAGGHHKYFERYFGEHAEQLGKLLDLFRPLDTDRAEIIATLYAVWNDFLLRGEPCDDDRIVSEVLTNWHDRKKRFDEDRWRRALGWMREKGLVPTGFGKPTVPGDSGNA